MDKWVELTLLKYRAELEALSTIREKNKARAAGEETTRHDMYVLKGTHGRLTHPPGKCPLMHEHDLCMNNVNYKA